MTDGLAILAAWLMFGGSARRRTAGPGGRAGLLPPLTVAGSPLRWDLPARALGVDPAEWPRR